MKSFYQRHESFHCWHCVIALLGLFIASGTVSAEPLDKGLLWKVQRNDSPPSYIFGTIHSEDPRVLRIPAPVDRAFVDARTLLLEIKPDLMTLTSVSKAMVFANGQRLNQLVPEAIYRRVEAVAFSHGITPQLLSSMKPWAVIMMLSAPRPKTGVFLDLQLYNMAVQAGKKVVGLETPAEQVAVIDSLALEDQLDLLELTLDQLPDLSLNSERLHQAYLKRDLGEMQRLSKTGIPKKYKSLTQKFLRRLLDDRNTRMVQRIERWLYEGQVFVAVGALHLEGSQGILQRLQSLGFSLSRIY